MLIPRNRKISFLHINIRDSWNHFLIKDEDLKSYFQGGRERKELKFKLLEAFSQKVTRFSVTSSALIFMRSLQSLQPFIGSQIHSIRSHSNIFRLKRLEPLDETTETGSLQISFVVSTASSDFPITRFQEPHFISSTESF